MIISKTPFRISFFGGGTDYPEWFSKHTGSALSLSIDKYCYISIRELPGFFENKHRVVWSKIEEVSDFKSIIHPAVREYCKKINPKIGLEINHQGDLPARSGLGSSSAFSVGLINSLNLLINKKKFNKKNLAKEAIFLERELLKENVGFQDQIATSYGGFNNIIIKKNGEFNVKKINIDKNDLDLFSKSLVLVFSGQNRIASNVAKKKIESFKHKEKEMLEILSLVKIAKKYITEKKFEEFGRLLHETWMLKKSLNPIISNKKIDEIYNFGLSNGAIGGKLLGAGSGGFLLFYVKPEKKNFLIKKLNKLLTVTFKIDNEGSTIIYNSNDKKFI